MEKTNVMRILDQKNIEYIEHTYNGDSSTTGVEVAEMVGISVERTYKTLVTISNNKKYYVFVVPVTCELDLKKGAQSVNEKSIEMIKQKDLLNVTGYVHGGCSPIGLKKNYPVIFDESITLFDKIMFSGGKIGYQVEMNVSDIDKVIDYTISDITK